MEQNVKTPFLQRILSENSISWRIKVDIKTDFVAMSEMDMGNG